MVENNVQLEQTATDYSTVLKFVICSLFGAVVFFVKIPIGGTPQLPIDYIVSLFTNALSPYYTYVLTMCTVIYIINLVIKKGWKSSLSNKIIIGFSILGGIMIFMNLFKIGPAFLFEKDIIPAAVTNMGKAFVMVFIVAFFLPFLLDFGLVDFIGVLTRPLMRIVLKLPGRTAVVAIGAFLGNFTVGHITSDKLYTSGRITRREAVIISTSLSTTSIALMLMYAKVTGQIGRWGLVVLVTTIVLFLVTAICVRIYPLSKIPDDYYPGTSPAPEEVVKTRYLSKAWNTGVEVARNAPNPFKAFWLSGTRSFIMIACIHVSAVSLWVIPALINKYTPIFSWLGSLFKPIFLLFGMPNADALANAVGLSFVNPISATVGLGALNLAPEAAFFAANFATPLVICFGAFLASMYSTRVPVKFKHVCIIAFERAVLIVVILCAICKLLF